MKLTTLPYFTFLKHFKIKIISDTIAWVWPPVRKEKQAYYIFSEGIPIHLHLPLLVGGSHTQIISISGSEIHRSIANQKLTTTTTPKVSVAIYTWQPLGPLLEVKLLVGYM